MTSSAKPEVHNISHCRQRRKKIGEIWTCGFRDICERTDRQTDRHADHNTWRPYRWRSTKCLLFFNTGTTLISFHCDRV